MKIIYNKHLPAKGFSAINLFGIIFSRKEYKPLSETIINHEAIHTAQMRELLFIPFYIWYGLEWIVRFTKYRNRKLAYRNISFEREAYTNQKNTMYLHERKFWGFTRYL